MKTIDHSAFRQREVIALLARSSSPLTLYEIAGELGIDIRHAKSLMAAMRLAHRVAWVTTRRGHFYGPAK